MGAIRPVAERLGITVRVCHGFSSTGMEGEVGRLFEGIEKQITVFYLGDHDPSGHVIEEDIHRRAQAASGLDFTMKLSFANNQTVLKPFVCQHMRGPFS
jgi:hypothetical protein